MVSMYGKETPKELYCGERGQKAFSLLGSIGSAQLIRDREANYGSFAHNSDISQKLKHIARQGDSWHKLEAHQKECLEMVLHKISRIVCGDPQYLDSWDDVAGYATRTAQIMKEKNCGS